MGGVRARTIQGARSERGGRAGGGQVTKTKTKTMTKIVLTPKTKLHIMLAQLRLAWGRCPRCNFETGLVEKCGVCMLWTPTKNCKIIRVYQPATDGQINTNTQKGWWTLFLRGIDTASMSRNAARIFERKNGEPPSCL